MVLFSELLQVSLGTRDSLSRVPSAHEWGALLDETQRQAVGGVMLCGVERLPQEQRPPKTVLLQWIGLTQMIEVKNEATTKACISVYKRFEKDGFKACVLKGQANHRYYPEGMGKRRSCGDVDVWVEPMEDGRGRKNDVRKTLEYVEQNHKLTGLCWLHCNFDEGEVPVEVHFHPSFMNEPIRNHRLQRWFGKMTDGRYVTDAGFAALPVEVDVVYQMNHIYRHLLDEGVGLRQIVDYYFVLKKYHTDGADSTEIMRVVSSLGMKRFAGALMWVLGTVCAMPREWMLCKPVEKDGRFLMNEIMMAGNFGHSDTRMVALNTSSLLKRRLSQAWRRFKRNLRFMTSYPSEVIWEPFARMYHFAWKKLKLWKL